MTLNKFKNFLDNKNCLKIICGAGNKDLKEITNLCALYAAAGCRFFDLNASAETIKAAKEGIRFVNKDEDCFLCASVGTKDDPHFVKCGIKPDKCSGCGECADNCPQKAITKTGGKYFINKDSCIGCTRCMDVCKHGAVKSYYEEMSLPDIIPQLINEGIDCLEYHIITDNKKEIYDGWKTITDLYKGPVSVCLDRSKLGNEDVIKCLKEMKASCNNLFMVQADGAPMSGGKDDYRTTLQAVAMADIIDKADITPYIFISGGTNSKTKKLAELCSIDATGISIGSYARKIVKDYIKDENFLTNKDLFNKALEVIQCII